MRCKIGLRCAADDGRRCAGLRTMRHGPCALYNWDLLPETLNSVVSCHENIGDASWQSVETIVAAAVVMAKVVAHPSDHRHHLSLWWWASVMAPLL